MEDINSVITPVKKGILVAVFPHPDDETMASGGLLYTAKKAGWRTVVLCLSHGEAGKIHIHPNGKSIKEIRGGELRKACEVLRVDEVIMGDFSDGKLRQTKQLWAGWLKNELNRIKPEIVVTYDPSGFYGHPDHIAVSEEVYKLRRNFDLFYVAFPKKLQNQYKDRIRGMNKVIKHMVIPTHVLNLKWDFIKKWRVVKVYRSQGLGKSLPIPLFLMLAVNHYEWYHKVSKQFEYKFRYTDYRV